VHHRNRERAVYATNHATIVQLDDRAVPGDRCCRGGMWLGQRHGAVPIAELVFAGTGGGR
jgi:hypothetical protein